MTWFKRIWNFISSDFAFGAFMVGVLVLIVAGLAYLFYDSAVWESQHAQIRFGKAEDRLVGDMLGKKISDRWIIESPEEIKDIRIISSERRYEHWHTIIAELTLQDLDEGTTHRAKVELVYDRRENLRWIRELEWRWGG